MGLLRFVALSAAISAALAARHGEMANFVTFGDSYTDESRARYISDHGHVPPPGQLLPPSNKTADGGVAWGRMVADMTGAQYYNYAVSGSTCSRKIATQPAGVIPGEVPTVLDYEIPAFEADLAFPSLYPNRRPGNTVYAMWIGTNDLGIQGFLHDRNMPGTTLDDLVECMWESFDHMYKTGGRRFFVLNVVPLEKSPTYASFENGGAGDNPVWPTKSQYNTTEYQYKMFQYSRAVNSLIDYSSPFHLLVKRRWPGASITILDVNAIFNDIIETPKQYLSPPQNVVSSYKTCDGDSNCEYSSLPKSSFLWYDMLHPSERTMEIVAKEFVSAVKGTSRYATSYASHC